MDTSKLKKIINLDWKVSQYEGAINRVIKTQFDLAMLAGYIPAHIERNHILVSKTWLSRQEQLETGYTRDFWDQVAELSQGKKISLDYETHIHLYYSSLEDFLKNEFEDIDEEDVFLAFLDLEKVNKHFTKKSIKELHILFDNNDEWKDIIYFDADLKAGLKKALDYNPEMPDGYSNWVAKTQPLNLGLNTPSNKMALILWKKAMADIKITKKVFNEVIETLSNDEEINREQWAIILQKVGTPKWLLSVMDSYWNTRISYGKDRIREMDSNNEFYPPTKANFIQLAPGR